MQYAETMQGRIALLNQADIVRASNAPYFERMKALEHCIGVAYVEYANRFDYERMHNMISHAPLYRLIDMSTVDSNFTCISNALRANITHLYLVNSAAIEAYAMLSPAQRSKVTIAYREEHGSSIGKIDPSLDGREITGQENISQVGAELFKNNA